MRIYKSCLEALSESVREVFSRGLIAFDKTVQGKIVTQEEYSMKELIGYCYTILDGSDKDKMFDWAKKHFPNYDGTLEWAEAWFQERISGKPFNPDPSTKLRWNYWSQFTKPDGSFSYTYSQRMYWQIDAVLKKMRSNLYMRGAIISIWDPHQDIYMMGRERVPCSISYHFLVRRTLDGDQLHLIYYIRSQDLVNHFPSDVYCAIRLGEYFSEQLGVKMGSFISYVDSLHAYRKDVAADRRW